MVIVYKDGSNSNYGTAIVGTVSGTSISFGDKNVFITTQVNQKSLVYDPINNKVVFAFNDTGGDSTGKVSVGEVTGTSINFLDFVTFNHSTVQAISLVYDTFNKKVILAYAIYNGFVGNANYGKLLVGTVVGDRIVFDTAPVTFESANTVYVTATYDSTNKKAVVAYRDDGNSSYGTSAVVDPLPLVTNLTEGNFIGIAAEAISNGATGKINIVGGINESQSGLTVGERYFTSPTGGISLNPIVPIGSVAVPIVVAGTAISATKIIVKG